MTNVSEPEPSQTGRFNQTLILRPFIAGASILALFTTWDGVSRLLNGRLLYNFISFTVSLGLVVVASYCSYQLGGVFANRLLGRSAEGRYGDRGLSFFVAAFMLTASVSGFFSYTFWHEQFYNISARGTDAKELPLELERAAMKEVEKEIKLETESEISAINDSRDIKDWIETGPHFISTLAGSNNSKFIRALQEANEKASVQNKTLTDKIDSLSAKLRTLNSEIADLNALAQSADHSLQDPAAEPALKQARATAEAEKQAGDLAAQGADSSKTAGCGSICLPHRAKQREAEKEIARLTAALKPQIEKRANLQNSVAEKTKARNELEAQIEKLKSQLLGAGGAPSAQTLSSSQALPNALGKFAEDPRDETQRQLEAACESTLAVAKAAFSGREDVNGADCEFKGLSGGALLQKRQAHLAAAKEWRAACDYSAALDVKGGLPARIQEISERANAPDAPPAQSLEEARKIIDSCVKSVAALGVAQDKIADIEGSVETFVRKNGLDRNEFERSMSDLTQLTPAALAGLLIASFVELSILVFKVLTDIVAARLRRGPSYAHARIPDLRDDPAEPAEIRAYKALMRNLRPIGGDSDEIRDEDIDSDDIDPELRRLVRATVMQLARAGQARRKGDGYSVAHSAIAAEIVPLLRAYGGDSRRQDLDAGKARGGQFKEPESPQGEVGQRESRASTVVEIAAREAQPAPSASQRPRTLGERLREGLGGERDSGRRPG